MKLLFIEDYRLCVLKDADHAVDVSAIVTDIPHTGPGDLMSGLIARFDAYRGRLEQAAASGTPIPLAGKRIRPPLPKPGNIVCMAVNYMEDGTLPAARRRSTPSTRRRPRSSAPATRWCCPTCRPRSSRARRRWRWSSASARRNVKAADAMDYVFGYVNFIDGSARGLKPPGNSFFQMKSRETFAPIGPCLVTADEIADPQKLRRAR